MSMNSSVTADAAASSFPHHADNKSEPSGVASPRFTPGPWVVWDRFPDCIIPADHTGRARGFAMDPDVDRRDFAQEIAVSCGPRHAEFGDREANARLIAAAPDLYAALERVVAVADRKTDDFDAARSALAKARGETA